MKPEKDIYASHNVKIGDQVEFCKGIGKVLNLYENTILVEYPEQGSKALVRTILGKREYKKL